MKLKNKNENMNPIASKHFQSQHWARIALLLWLALVVMPVAAREYEVATNGDDSHPGTVGLPLRTIQHAADLAMPGDVILVHQGIYRERVNPPRGGLSDDQRITYQAAAGEKVEIKGSEIVTNWAEVQPGVWRATLPNTFFAGFNPYTNLIHGDWFNPQKRQHHTGSVYLNGDWLTEAATLEDVLELVPTNQLWFATADATNTLIWARFGTANPHGALVEINARQTVFYPAKTGVNFLTVRGFILSQAATPWAPPTAEQIGLIGTHWSRGWIIESNIISYSICAGVTLGKYSDEWDNRAESAEGYVGTIRRALTNGWDKAAVGHHRVRANDISHCEQGGIIGSLGGAFSQIEENDIHDIYARRLFSGAEMAGIKLHGAIDVKIARNHIYRCWRGIWLDWMAQGARLSANLLHDNSADDLFFEVDHGPILVDDNLLLSPTALKSWSQGATYAHNFFAGKIETKALDARQTPFLKPHATELAGLTDNPRGDDRYFNNVFVGKANLSPYDQTTLPVKMAGNVFLSGARPAACELNPFVQTNSIPPAKIIQRRGIWYLEASWASISGDQIARSLVTTELMGRTAISGMMFENPDGSALAITHDYFGKPWAKKNPPAGPFSDAIGTKAGFQVWPNTN